MSSLTELSSHYEFGRNWQEFVARLPEKAVDEAIASMSRLIRPEEIAGRRLLDIGCGSGLHALAALRLGAESVYGIDLDPESVATSMALLTRFAPGEAWTVEQRSVFESACLDHYDIVYSWGVLHHTGDMHRAIRLAVERTLPGGLVCLALYRRTPMCRMWRSEKYLYKNAPASLRRILETIYIWSFKIGFAVMS